MTERLDHIRYHAQRLVSMPNTPIRQIGVSILAEIDAAKVEVPAPIVTVMDLGSTSMEDLLRELEARLSKKGLAYVDVDRISAEIAKRIRTAQGRRNVAQMCGDCKTEKARAKGLCLRCYQRQRKTAKK